MLTVPAVRFIVFSDNENLSRDFRIDGLAGVDPFSFTANAYLYSLNYAFVRALYTYLEDVSEDVITITET